MAREFNGEDLVHLVTDRDAQRRLVHLYNATVVELERTPEKHNVKRAGLEATLESIRHELERALVAYAKYQVPREAYFRLELVKTPEEEADYQAQKRKFAADQLKTQLRRARDLYHTRLIERRNWCDRELAKLDRPELGRVDDSEFGSTASLDLPRLSTKIRALEDAIRAYEDGEWM